MSKEIEFQRFNPFGSVPPSSPQRGGREEIEYQKNDEVLRDNDTFKKIAKNFGYDPTDVDYLVERKADRYWIRLFNDLSDERSRRRFTVAKGSDLETILKKFYDAENPPADPTPPPKEPLKTPEKKPAASPSSDPVQPDYDSTDSHSPLGPVDYGVKTPRSRPDGSPPSDSEFAHTHRPLPPFNASRSRPDAFSHFASEFAPTHRPLTPFNYRDAKKPLQRRSMPPIPTPSTSAPLTRPSYASPTLPRNTQVLHAMTNSALGNPSLTISDTVAVTGAQTSGMAAAPIAPRSATAPQAELEKLQKKASQLQDQLAAATQAKSEAENRLETLQQGRASLQTAFGESVEKYDALDAMHQRISQLTDSKYSLEEELDKTAKGAAELGQRVAEMSVALDEAHRRASLVSELEDQLDELTREREALQQEKTELHRKFEQEQRVLQSGLERTREEVNRIGKELDEARATAGRVPELVDLAKKALAAKDAAEKQAEVIANQLASLQDDKTDLQGKLDLALRQISELEEEIAQLRAALQEATQRADQVSVLEGQLCTRTGENEALRRERTNLSDRFKEEQASLRSDLEANRKEQERVARELGETQTIAGRVPRLEELLEEASSAQKTAEDQVGTLTNELDASKQEIDRLNRDLRDATERAALASGLEGRLDALTREREALLREKTELQEKLEAARKEVNRIGKEFDEARAEETLAAKADLQDKLDPALRQISELEKNLLTRADEYEALKQELTDFSAWAAEKQAALQSDLDENRRELERVDRELGEVQALADRMPGLWRELDALSNERADLRLQIQILQGELDEDESARLDLEERLGEVERAGQEIAEELKKERELAARVPEMQQLVKAALAAKEAAERRAIAQEAALAAAQRTNAALENFLAESPEIVEDLHRQIAEEQEKADRATELFYTEIEQVESFHQEEKAALEKELREVKAAEAKHHDELDQALAGYQKALRSLQEQQQQDIAAIARELEQLRARPEPVSVSPANGVSEDVELLQERLSQVIDEREEETKKLRAAESEMIAMQKSLAASRKEKDVLIADLEEKLREKGADLDQMKQDLKEGKERFRQQKQELTETWADISQTRDEANELTRQLEKATAANKELESERFKLERALAAKTAELAERNNEAAGWMRNIKDYQAQTAQEMAALEERTASLERERNALFLENRRLIQSNQVYVNTLESPIYDSESDREQIESLSAELSEVQKALAQTQRLCEEAERAKEAAEQKLEEMRESSDEERRLTEIRTANLQRKVARLEGRISPSSRQQFLKTQLRLLPLLIPRPAAHR